MPRIDPLQLLKILSVLLAPNGGIKTQEEVPRLASLMTKFSKKLVSKCIYVSILKATNPDLLVMWMSAGGWDLIYNWLSDGVQMQNWPLVTELVELLLICPVDIERLKTNRCPKLIKTLSKNPEATESVRQYAAEIVKKWLMVVNEVLTKQKDELEESESEPNTDVAVEHVQVVGDVPSSEENTSDGHPSVYRIVIRDGKEVLAEVVNKDRTKDAEAEVPTVGASQTKEDKHVTSPDSVGKQNLKVKKVMELNMARKIGKDRLSDASEASTSSSAGDKVDEKPRNKNDPARDRRKDKMRQIRKDPDEDDFLETLNDSKDSKSPKEKKSSKDNSAKGKVSDKLKGSKSSPNVSSSGSSKTSSLTPDMSKLGKIPKKSKSSEKSSSSSSSSGSDVSDRKSKSSEKKDRDAKVSKSEKDEVKSISVKKPPAPPPPKPERDSKKYNISIESRKLPPGESRPKTVKTYNSKFRSTGLEEELPLQPKSTKKSASSSVSPSAGDKKAIKRSSPPKEAQPPEKKVKSETKTSSEPTVEPAKSVPAAATPPEKEPKIDAKSVSAKPKLHLLQESDSFMDAINAANTKKEPRKRKRRTSGSKDDIKKEEPESPTNQSPTSPALVKPNFKFYQDTMENEDSTIKEEDKKKIKLEKDADDGADSNSENKSPSPEREEYTNTAEEIKNEQDRQNSEGLRGVLVFAKLRKGPKKKVSWKEDIEDIKEFEVFENERVNVTKTFLDMKQMERIHERENFAIARKLTNEDIMEEKIRWKVLIPCDAPALPVIPGNNSAEKDIQYAREKTVAPALYFNKRLIPDSPAEPDLEIHATTDPTNIPLDDVSGNEDSVNDFTNTPWPEPKTAPPQQEPLIARPPTGPIMPGGPMPNFGPGGPPPGGPGFPGPDPGPPPGPSLLGPVPVPPPMGFPGFSGPPGMFGPPQPPCPPGGMGMMPPGDWRGPVNDMKGPGGPGPGPMPPEMFGPGPPGMMPQPGLLPPPDMPFGMQPPGPMPGPPDDMNFPGGPPFNMNQGPPGGPMGNMFPGPHFPNNNNNSGNNNRDNQGGNNNGNWYRSNGPGGHQGRHDDDRDRGGPRERGNFRNKRDRGGRNEGRGSWRGGRGGGDSWRGDGGKSSILCNNYTRWGSCRSNNCPYRHPK